jgi:hypothetical protein
LFNSSNHVIRRNIGKKNFSNIEGYYNASSIKKYSVEIESLINAFLKSKMLISFIKVDLGRKELEERLILKYQPKYNNLCKEEKINKAYSVAEKRLKNQNAYMPWSKEDDDKLELLFCEKKSIKELSEIFCRNSGAIRSRIKKLELEEKYNN